MAASFALNSIGASLYTAVALHVDAGHASSWLLYLLLVARILTGVGLGLWTQLANMIFKNVTPAAELPWQMVRVVMANMIGIGLGPILASAAAMASPGGAGFALEGAISVIMCVMAMVGLTSMFPSLDSEALDEQINYGTVLKSSKSTGHCSRPRVLICACLLNVLIRAYCVSGVEVASALLLEESHLWPKSLIGLAMGGTFLLAIPFKTVYDTWKCKYSIGTWMRSLCLLTMVGCCLLFKFPRVSGWNILIGDAIIFSPMYLCDGLIVGVLLQTSSPTSSAFNANSCILWNMLSSSAGRLLGPWLARMWIQNYGQDAYALTQLAACMTFIAVYELVIRRLMAEET
jgi:hypothetical protein